MTHITRTKSLIPSSLLQQLLSFLIFMAVLTLQPDPAANNSHLKNSSKRKKKLHTNNSQDKQQQSSSSSSSSSSWDQFKNLLTCKQVHDSQIHHPSKNPNPHNNRHNNNNNNNNPPSNIYSSCSSICSFRDVVHGNTRVVNRSDNSPDGSTVGQETRLLSKKQHNPTTTTNHAQGSLRSAASRAPYSTSRGLQLRKLSGCYECHAIVDPTRYPLPRSSICACPQCGEVFPKIESLEHHQAVRHAVCELGPDDSSRNIVEIIFKSSWLKRDNPICKIERILKVQPTQRTIQRFEDYRDAVKTRGKSSARCAADGNELLRFHSATLTCALGARGSSSLCGSVPACGVCTIIRHGFPGSRVTGIRTTASSGRAHDCLGGGASDARRAMLVCRVIAGRVKCAAEDAASAAGVAEESGSSYDSVASYAGVYANMEELCVFSARAILPCFVVIYRALQS